MSHFEWRLNQRFWRSKKVVQVVQIRGRGGGGEGIWTKSKRTATFFGWPSLSWLFPHSTMYDKRQFESCRSQCGSSCGSSWSQCGSSGCWCSSRYSHTGDTLGWPSGAYWWRCPALKKLGKWIESSRRADKAPRRHSWQSHLPNSALLCAPE